MPGERKVWITLLILGWFVLIWVLASALDPSVFCSANQPC